MAIAITGIDRTAEMITRCLRLSTRSTPAASSVELPALPSAVPEPVAPGAPSAPGAAVRGSGSRAEYPACSTVSSRSCGSIPAAICTRAFSVA